MNPRPVAVGDFAKEAAILAELVRAQVWRWSESHTARTGIPHRPAELARQVIVRLQDMLKDGEWADERMSE